jgi:hypothetical protein
LPSTTPERPTRNTPRASRFQPPHTLDPKLSENVAQLSQQLATERDARLEERFYWILITTVLFSCAMFPHLPPWLSIPLFVLAALILPGLAARLGVDWAVKGLEQFRRFVMERFKKPDEEPKPAAGAPPKIEAPPVG